MTSARTRAVRRALVIVQGDLGRSPRMQYHAYALAVNDVQVDLIGLAGVPPIPHVVDYPGITCHQIADGGRWARRGAIGMAWRGLALAVGIVRCLRRLPPPDVVIVQIPPAAPVGVIAWLFARFRGARLILDWHNLGWSLLALNRDLSWLLPLYRRVEHWLGSRADRHLAVSRALGQHLAATLATAPAVLYDRPPEWLCPVPAEQRAGLRARLCGSAASPEATVIILSPTSWTADEDLDLIFDAAAAIERASDVPSGFPHVLFLASGRGPARAAFERRAAAVRPRRTSVSACWVEPGEYPALLSAADAGLCLHRSSSRLDLPMKIADMFGAGLPVLALHYPTLGERVDAGKNGQFFSNAEELSRLILTLWSGPGRPQLAALRAGAAATGLDRWTAGWNREARPVVLGAHLS